MDPTNLTFTGALLYSIIGFSIVFVALISLLVIIKIMAAIVNAGSKKKAAPAPAAAAPAPVAAAAPAAAPAPAGVPAPGTAGQIKLYTVSDKEAAMIMAIVASKMNKPLNELRFKSIKEVK